MTHWIQTLRHDDERSMRQQALVGGVAIKAYSRAHDAWLAAFTLRPNDIFGGIDGAIEMAKRIVAGCRKEVSISGKELSSHDIAVDALENLLHQLDLSPPDYETHPELCAAIAAAREDLLTIKTRVFAGMGKQLSETGKEVSEAAS